MLIYFLKGKITMARFKGKDKKEQRSKIKFTKISTRLSELCSGLPGEFYNYLCYCKIWNFQNTKLYIFEGVI